jgi:hypothetical protein
VDNPIYLGDGVYASFDGYHVVLTANIPTTDTIYLDSHVAEALVKYINELRKKAISDD